MGIRTIADFPRNEPGLVDRFLGTQYDVVRAIYEQLDILIQIPELMTAAQNLQNEIQNSIEQYTNDSQAIQNAIAQVQAMTNTAYGTNKLYANIVTGLLNTNFGDFFTVPDPKGSPYFATLYQNINGNPVEYGKIPSFNLFMNIPTVPTQGNMFVNNGGVLMLNGNYS